MNHRLSSRVVQALVTGALLLSAVLAMGIYQSTSRPAAPASGTLPEVVITAPGPRPTLAPVDIIAPRFAE